MSALNPCPFCGSSAKPFERHNPMSKWRWSVDCDTCGMSGPVEATKADAITAWQRCAPVPDLLGALKGASSWLERWAQHVGRCAGDTLCVCGLTAIRYEAGSAIAAASGIETGTAKTEGLGPKDESPTLEEGDAQ